MVGVHESEATPVVCKELQHSSVSTVASMLHITVCMCMCIPECVCVYVNVSLWCLPGNIHGSISFHSSLMWIGAHVCSVGGRHRSRCWKEIEMGEGWSSRELRHLCWIELLMSQHMPHQLAQWCGQTVQLMLVQWNLSIVVAYGPQICGCNREGAA